MMKLKREEGGTIQDEVMETLRTNVIPIRTSDENNWVSYDMELINLEIEQINTECSSLMVGVDTNP